MENKKHRVLSMLMTICIIFSNIQYAPLETSGAEALDATAYTYVTEPGPSYEGNPLKGMFPYSNRNTNNLPYSMEWVSLPVSAVHFGEERFDWKAFEEELNAVASRGHHAAVRFWYTYPMKSDNGFGVPQYVLDHEGENLELTPYGDPEDEPEQYNNLQGWGIWPDHSNKYLIQSMEEFIAAFGEKYDGDVRIGFVTLGLLGFWGEWHNWPYGEADEYPQFVIPTETYKAALDAYDAAFNTTQLCVREPKNGIDYSNYNIGYHDDSFVYSTLLDENEDWYFLSMLDKFGELDKWETQCIGGELYPPMQRYDYYTGAGTSVSGMVIQDWEECVTDSHASWLINNSYADYEGDEIERARAASVELGYDFQVLGSYYDEDLFYENVNSSEQFELTIDIINQGNAPFYYGVDIANPYSSSIDNWPVVIGLMQGNEILKEWMTNWELKDIFPDGETYSFTTVLDNMPALGYENYEIYMKVLNPLNNLDMGEDAKAGNILGFANIEQRADGWLKIGELNYGEDEVEVEPETDIVLDETIEIQNTITAWIEDGYIYCNLAHNVDYDNWQLFIETDNDNTVGYNDWIDGGPAYDYYVENGYLSKHTGTGNGWSWSTDTVGVEYEKGTNNILTKIPVSELGEVKYPVTLKYKLLEGWDAKSVSDTATVELETAEMKWVPVKEDADIPVSFDYTYVDNSGAEVADSVEVNGYVEYYDAYAFTNTEKVVGNGDDIITLTGKEKYYTGSNRTTVEIVNTGVSDNSGLLIDGSVQQIPVNKYSEVSAYAQDMSGQMQLDVPEVFSVTSITTYYMLKITATDDSGNESVTYLPFRITVNPGKVSLRAYQMNVSTAEGAVSEFNPSFRVVSRAPKLIIGNDGRLHGVVGFGTLYAIDSEIAGGEMRDGVEGVVNYKATSEGVLVNWPNSLADTDKEDYNYFALTFKGTKYYLDMLTFRFKLKAYAILDDGTIAYQKEFVNETSIYDIAGILYDGNRMSNQSSHDFLYNHVLNIVSMKNNRLTIASKMLEVLNGVDDPSVSDDAAENRTLINNVYKDMQYYVNLINVYYRSRYWQRPEFDSATLYGVEKNGDRLLTKLNMAEGADYGTLSEWIYENVPHETGFYKKTEWEISNSLVPVDME